MSSPGPNNHSSTPNSSLPSEVIQCLQNARFLHLATCTSVFPHVSLMNYTYLPSSPYLASPQIIMTTPPSSRKTLNIVSNAHVSLLVHDWVSHRPPTTATTYTSPSSSPEPSRSSLASLLARLNTSGLASISAEINGEARLVERGTSEERWLRERHLENNTFGEGDLRGRGDGDGDGGREIYVEGEEVRVIVVEIREGRVADWKGNTRDFDLGKQERETLVNGAE